MKDWRIVVVFAAGAFFLSVAAGIAGGVSAGIIMLRALTGSILFGGFGYLLKSFLFPRFLPELFEDSSSPGDTDDAEAVEVTGSNVDIVIEDEESPAGSGSDDFQSPEKEGEFSEPGTVDGAEADNAGMEEETVIEVSPGNVEEILDTAGENDSGGLPNIDAFSDVFNSVETETDRGASLTGSVSVDIMGQQEDPGTVAKAIRTIMKKDQEG